MELLVVGCENIGFDGIIAHSDYSHGLKRFL